MVTREIILKQKGERKKGEVQEWKQIKRWNPFNSYKLLTQVSRWKHIKRGRPIPPPILVTVDPSNNCNFDCDWCNADYVRKERVGMISEKALLSIADFLPRWGEGDKTTNPGVEAICVAGGGEPFLNKSTPTFIDRVIYNGIEVGVVTNGTEIINCIDVLSHCTWVGVSIDAATSATFNKLKRLPSNKNYFDRVLNNVSNLIDYSKRHNYKLGYSHPAYGVSYKYLLYKENIGEMYEAAKLAKEIGCKNIHFRPAGSTWDKLDTEKEITFTDDEIALFKRQITKALELDDEGFGVYGVTHKFNTQFERANYFNKCYAIFMTAVFMPPYEKDAAQDSFVLGFCCDRRGEKKLETGKNIIDVNEIQKFWGSKEHWKIHDSINPGKDCPRCTYQPHNEIYEQVILNDSMTHKFI